MKYKLSSLDDIDVCKDVFSLANKYDFLLKAWQRLNVLSVPNF